MTALCEEVELRGYLETAAAAIGLSPSTVQGWYSRGKGESDRPALPEFVEFASRIDQARQKGIGDRLRKIREAGDGGFVVERVTETRRDGTVIEREKLAAPDWRASAFLPERADPERYGSKRTLNVEGSLTVKHVEALVELVLPILRRYVPAPQFEAVALELSRGIDGVFGMQRLQVPGPVKEAVAG